MGGGSRAEKIQVLRHFQHFPASACASKGAFRQQFWQIFSKFVRFSKWWNRGISGFGGFWAAWEILSWPTRSRSRFSRPGENFRDFQKKKTFSKKFKENIEISKGFSIFWE